MNGNAPRLMASLPQNGPSATAQQSAGAAFGHPAATGGACCRHSLLAMVANQIP